MAIDNTQRVVGLFGSHLDDPVVREGVERLARAVHDNGALVLSGADPPLDGYAEQPHTVKDLAVYGLRGVPTGPSALWAGVARHVDAQQPRPYDDRGVVVTPGWDHGRNLIEAAVCDAAVAIAATTPGTASEALFCLYLGRPLALVADGPAGTERTAAELGRLAGGVDGADDARWAVDVGIAQARLWARTSHEAVTTQSLPRDDAGAFDLVSSLLESVPARRPDRAFERLADTAAWDRYVRDALETAGRRPS